MATTITLLLVVVLVQVFDGASSTWRRTEAQVDAYREARGALQLMARDLGATLQASYAQAGGGADPASATTNGPVMPTLVLEHYPGGPTYQGAPINEEVYCLTNISNHGSSSLCAVGYYCQWMADNAMFPADPSGDHRPRAFALMRQSLDSDGTFQRMKAQASSTKLGFTDLFQRALSYNESASTPPQAFSAQVAAYVWDLRFRIDTDLNDSPNGGIADGNSPSPNDHSGPPALQYAGDMGKYPARLPPYIEIRFKALSSIAGRRLEGANAPTTYSTWNDNDPNFTPTDPAYKQIIEPNFQQFVLRVPFINATPPSN